MGDNPVFIVALVIKSRKIKTSTACLILQARFLERPFISFKMYKQIS